MKNIKILFLSLFSFFLIILAGYVNAQTNESTTYNGFHEPIISDDFHFEVGLLDNGSVKAYWKAYNKDEKLKYYKLVRSSKNSNPVYPDDGYIKYSSDINFTSYVDYSAPRGVNYYRVCAITYENNRYCSNVEKVYKEESEKTVICTREYKPVCGEVQIQCITTPCNNIKKTFSNKCMLNGAGAKYLYYGECGKQEDVKEDIKEEIKDKLSYNLKFKLDKIAKDFIVRVEKKYTSNEKRIEILKSVIYKFEKLANQKPQVKDLIVYLIERFKHQINSYDDGFSDIEDILNEF